MPKISIELSEDESTTVWDAMFATTPKLEEEKSILESLKQPQQRVELTAPSVDIMSDDFRKVTQTLQYLEEDKHGNWSVYYSMADDPTHKKQMPYRVPKEVLPLLEKAAEAGILAHGKSFAVEMERINGCWYWIALERYSPRH